MSIHDPFDDIFNGDLPEDDWSIADAFLEDAEEEIRQEVDREILEELTESDEEFENENSDDSLSRMGINDVITDEELGLRPIDHEDPVDDPNTIETPNLQDAINRLNDAVENHVMQIDEDGVRQWVDISAVNHTHTNVPSLSINDEEVATRNYVDEQIAAAQAAAVAAETMAINNDPIAGQGLMSSGNEINLNITQEVFDNQIRHMVEQVVEMKINELMYDHNKGYELDMMIQNGLNYRGTSTNGIEQIVKDYLLDKLNRDY